MLISAQTNVLKILITVSFDVNVFIVLELTLYHETNKQNKIKMTKEFKKRTIKN